MKARVRGACFLSAAVFLAVAGCGGDTTGPGGDDGGNDGPAYSLTPSSSR